MKNVFDNKSSHILSQLSEYAYPPEARDNEKGIPLVVYEVQEDEIRALGADLLSVFIDKVNSVECYCVRIMLTINGVTRPAIAYVYRGTHGLQDIGTDIMAGMVKTSYGMVHEGFRRYYQFSREWMLDILFDNHKDLTEPVVATGHSLGGGGAANCALENEFYLATFGCPTVGDAEANSKIEALPGAVRFWQLFDRITFAPSGWTNKLLGTTYDWGPWKGCGKLIGVGMHASSSYSKKLSKTYM